MASSAERQILELIGRRGKVTFAQFMELALYHPVDGYYSRRPSVGAEGDFYTSSVAHPAFGALLAVQLHLMWKALGHPLPFHAVEVGAGSGLLAREIVSYASNLPTRFSRALRYLAVDRSHLHAARDDRSPLRRVVAGRTPFKGLVGCILSNELVDSFPTHRFQIEGGALREVYVTLGESGLTEVLGAPSTPLLAGRLAGLALPDGTRGEVNLGIGPWMAEVSGALERGFVLTIDYGHESRQLYSPSRARGTLQTYRAHTQASDPYRNIGMQDITAHVDFSAVISEGQAAGLRPLVLQTQSQLLRALGIDGWLRALRTKSLPQRERDANMMAMRDLVRPDGLGAFKVLVQEKGTGVTDPAELAPGAPLANDLPVQLLRPEHMRLLEGRYPHAAWEVEGAWPRGEEAKFRRQLEDRNKNTTAGGKYT